MSKIQLATLFVAMMISMIVSYMLSIAILGIMLGLGVDMVISSIVAFAGSLVISIDAIPTIEKASVAIVKSTVNAVSRVKSFIRSKKDEMDASRFNKANGFTLVKV